MKNVQPRALSFLATTVAAILGACAPAPESPTSQSQSSQTAESLQRGERKILDVPYLSQYDDATIATSSSCGNTSISMVLRYYNIKFSDIDPGPDDVRSKYDPGGRCGNGTCPWQSQPGIKGILEDEGLTVEPSLENADDEVLKKQLWLGHPVIVNTDFTGSGHIVVFIGFDDVTSEWIVNDPAGRWCGNRSSGYGGRGNETCPVDANGKAQRYPYELMTESAKGGPGFMMNAVAVPQVPVSQN